MTNLMNLFVLMWFLTALIRDLDLSDIPVWNVRRTPLRIALIVLHKLITCEKCLSFWLTLILTRDFFMSAGVSFLIWTTWKVIGNIKTKL